MRCVADILYDHLLKSENFKKNLSVSDKIG